MRYCRLCGVVCAVDGHFGPQANADIALCINYLTYT